mgnify:CR=1 FL=1
MLTHVYDQVCEVQFYVSNITLVDEEPQENGTQYEIDLIPCYSPNGGECVEECPELHNVPMMYNEKENKYYIADISVAIQEAEDNGLDVYNYNSYNPNNPNVTTQLHQAEYKDGMITSTGATYTEPHTTVSIYQDSKEPTTKEATTIAELIEILEEIQDYTEVVVSGAFCKAIKRSK